MHFETMRTYKRKTHRGDTPDDVMRDAVNQVVVGGKPFTELL